MKEFIEIPFGARDSETLGWEYTIPEGFVASIENGKIVVKKEDTDEDEKIRNEICIYIGAKQDISLDTHNRWLAWLEKQGNIDKRIQEEIEKQTKQQWKVEKQGDNVSGECNDTALQEQLNIWFEKGKCSGIDDVIFHPQKYGLEKQSEQKPVDFKAKDWYVSKVDGKIHNMTYNPTDKVEPNPTWSEADETALCDALWCCKQAACIAKDENDMGTIWYAETWLKSLKDRVQPQWKPSEEQIQALDEVYKTHGANSVCRRIIFKLLEQLKKL